MNTLEKYLTAVETRKALGPNGTVNWAIASQLETRDIPLLLQIIRVYQTERESTVFFPAEARANGDEALNALAAKGDCSRWGDYVKDAPTVAVQPLETRTLPIAETMGLKQPAPPTGLEGW